MGSEMCIRDSDSDTSHDSLRSVKLPHLLFVRPREKEVDCVEVSPAAGHNPLHWSGPNLDRTLLELAIAVLGRASGRRGHHLLACERRVAESGFTIDETVTATLGYHCQRARAVLGLIVFPCCSLSIPNRTVRYLHCPGLLRLVVFPPNSNRRNEKKPGRLNLSEHRHQKL